MAHFCLSKEREMQRMQVSVYSYSVPPEIRPGLFSKLQRDCGGEDPKTNWEEAYETLLKDICN